MSDVLHSWKSFTSHGVNKLVGRGGELWQGESYDQLVRDEYDLAHCVEYTLRNAERAGLVGWRWVGKIAKVGFERL